MIWKGYSSWDYIWLQIKEPNYPTETNCLFHITQSGSKPCRTIPCYKMGSTEFLPSSHLQAATSYQSLNYRIKGGCYQAHNNWVYLFIKDKITSMISFTTIQFLITSQWLELCDMEIFRGEETKETDTFLPLTKLRLYWQGYRTEKILIKKLWLHVILKSNAVAWKRNSNLIVLSIPKIK